MKNECNRVRLRARMSRLAAAPSHSGLMDIDRVTNAIFERKERDVLKVSKLIVIAALSILGSQCLFAAASAADDFDFKLSTAAPLTAQGYSNTDSFDGDGIFVTTDVIASPDKKTTCPAPPQKTKSKPAPAPKSATVVKPDVLSITNVCSPVINIKAPSGTMGLHSKSAFVDHEPDPELAVKSPANTVETQQQTLAPETIKLRIKGFMDAELRTHSTALMWVFIVILIGLIVIAILNTRAALRRSNPSNAARIALILSIVLAAGVFYLLLRNPVPIEVQRSVIDRAFNDLVTVETAPVIEPSPSLSAFSQQLTAAQAEIAQSQSQLSSQLNQIARTIEPTKDNNTWWQLFALIVWGTAFIYVLLNWHTRHLAQAALTNKVVDSPLPLDALYNLEETIAKVVATGTRSAANIDQEIEFNEVLQAINSVRKQLESGSDSVDSDKRSVTFHLRARSIEFRHLETVLRELEDELISRYKRPRELWRKRVLIRLTAARRAIISTCRASPADSDLSIT